MGSSKDRMKITCYIGETRFSAGIFLTKEVLKKLQLVNNVRWELFDEFSVAYEMFQRRYSNVIELEHFQVNHLYPVRDRNIYSVFSTPYIVGITYSECYAVNVGLLLANRESIPWAKHDLEYEEAVKIARERFVKYWKNFNYYIEGRIRVNQPIRLEDVLKQNTLKN